MGMVVLNEALPLAHWLAIGVIVVSSLGVAMNAKAQVSAPELV